MLLKLLIFPLKIVQTSIHFSASFIWIRLPFSDTGFSGIQPSSSGAHKQIHEPAKIRGEEFANLKLSNK